MFSTLTIKKFIQANVPPSVTQSPQTQGSPQVAELKGIVDASGCTQHSVGRSAQGDLALLALRCLPRFGSGVWPSLGLQKRPLDTSHHFSNYKERD